jgi:hypothetical protein
LFTLIPLCLLFARFFTSIYGTMKHKTAPSKIVISVVAMLLVATVGMLAYTDISIITRPDKAPIAERLRWQFIEGWPSGYGVSDLVGFLEGEVRAGDESVYVMRFFNWDQAHQGVNLHLRSNKTSSDDSGLEFIATLEPEMLEPSAEGLIPNRRTFIVLDRANSEAVAILDEFQPLMNAELVWSHVRPGGASGLEVWEIFAILTDSISGDQT